MLQAATQTRRRPKVAAIAINRFNLDTQATDTCVMAKRNGSLNSPKPSAAAFFCGMGGFASGMLRAGFDVRWANDNNRFACEVFRHRLPQVRLMEKDVADVDIDSDGLCDVDVAFGGFPCQPFSIAGHRRGFDDDRGHALEGMMKVVDSMQSKPSVIVLENVPAISEWADEVIEVVESYGYHLPLENFWSMNVYRDVGIPQDRTRTFMVATSDGSHISQPVPMFVDQAPLSEFVDKSRKASPELYMSESSQYHSMLQKKIAEGSTKNLFHLRRVYVREKQDGLCPTLTANMGTGGHNVPLCKDRWGIRKVSPEEAARLQGFDSDNVFPDEMSNTQKYRLTGNAMCVSLAQLVGETVREHLERQHNGK